jgi:UDP-2-acetamido-3-amino-2,3-dideoxy-glucuronate N-acetyltransferase
MDEVFVHSHAICESINVGKKTRIWAFSHILPDAVIGQDCNICDHVFIENNVVIGDRVTIKCGVQLWDGIEIENDVFIGPNVTFTNDSFPRSKKYPDKFKTTQIKNGASIGANATILPGLVVGSNAMIGAGAVVTRSVPSNAIVVGNPANIVGYAETHGRTPVLPTSKNASSGIETEIRVKGVKLQRLNEVRDLRGNLTAAEVGKDVPFDVKRYFIVYDVPSLEVRGEHAHRLCKQFLVALKGKVHVMVDDGSQREEFILDSPNLGLYMPPMTWGVQYKYSSNAILMVLASEPYDADDYIRNYEEFVDKVK